MLLKGAFVHDGLGDTRIQDVLIENGRIARIAEKIDGIGEDVSGCHLLPGFVQAISIWGVMGNMTEIRPSSNDNDEHSNPITPELDGFYAFNGRAATAQQLGAFGLTCAGVAPTDNNLFGGTVAAFAVDGVNPYRMCLKRDIAMMASVTPAVNVAWERLVREEAGLSLGFVRHDMPLPFSLDFDHPESAGADRLADMAAAALLYGAPALVVDIGTAVTYDLLSADRRFFTGVIGPGPEILARSLHDYTALLPLVEWWRLDPPEVPKNTEGAMLFGIDAGFSGALRETVSRLLPRIGPDAHLIATGGFAKRFANLPGRDFVVDPDLTLRGVGLIAAGGAHA